MPDEIMTSRIDYFAGLLINKIICEHALNNLKGHHFASARKNTSTHQNRCHNRPWL